MSGERVMNRWLVVVGAILIQLCLGAVYAWSVFTSHITRPLDQDGLYGFTATQSAWIFSVELAAFALMMILAGKLQAKVGPRPISILGGIVMGIGYILGGFHGQTFLGQLVFIGPMGGAGIGLVYVVPIAVGVKWFPDKKGMITGLTVAGFGFGAMLWIKLAESWFGGLLNTTMVFGLPGVQSVFVIYGVIFLVCIILGSIVMVNPPAGYKPEGWEPPAAGVLAKATGAVNLTAGEMLATPQFYMLWLMFAGSALAGLMVISCIKLFGIDALRATGAVTGENAAEAAGYIAGTAMSSYAIFNGLGRIVWGMISDKIGRKASLFLLCLTQGAIMFAFYKIGGFTWGLFVGASIIGFNYGGNFALFPAATADYFGNKNLGTNYGWVFLAYGVGGITGPLVAGLFKDAAQTGDPSAWLAPFVIAGMSCVAAAVLALFLKVPSHQEP